MEAGGNPFPLQNIPALAPLMIGHKDLDWGFKTVPQTFSCMSLTNRVNEENIIVHAHYQVKNTK